MFCNVLQYVAVCCKVLLQKSSVTNRHHREDQLQVGRSIDLHFLCVAVHWGALSCVIVSWFRFSFLFSFLLLLLVSSCGKRTILCGMSETQDFFDRAYFIHIPDDVILALLVRAWDCQSWGRRFDSGKTQKSVHSNLNGFELHRLFKEGY